MKNGFSIKSFAGLLFSVVLLATVTQAEARYSNKWRLQFSGGANSDGTIIILILPKGGEPVEAQIQIVDGTGENAVAKAVVAGLRAQLPRDGYHIERDDGEDVLIKKRRGAARFEVEIASNNVKGVRINPDRE